MKLNTIILSLLLLTTSFLYAQNEDVLFTVDNETITVKEFIRVYQKNINLIQDEKQKDVDEYLNLYVNYKLKLAAAKSLGLDKDKKYLNELKSYRKQLAEKYLTDTDINDKLINEAYTRTLEEVNVEHILVKCAPTAKPSDTLIAFNKIQALRGQVLKDGFNETSIKVHNGENIFGESLGFFDAFKMVYLFETKAYNTQVGEISQPFRTQFGYHILHVLEKRKSRGEVSVAHIMVSSNNKKLTGTAKEKIQEINKQLTEGANFGSLAKQFSDDRGSASKGGVLQRFGSGKISDLNFENAAFSLQKEGELSTPIQSKYGWHIIKLIKKYPVPELGMLKSQISQKIKKDSRSKIVNDQFYTKLKKRFKYKEMENAKEKLLKVVDQSFLGGKITPAEKNQNTLFSFGNKKVSFQAYYQYLRSKIRGYKNLTKIDKIVNTSLNEFTNLNLYNYLNDNLENEYEDFAAIMQEYREGLLLFELMEKQVWQQAKKDTVGLKSFYESNKEKYFWEKRINATIVTSSTKKAAKKAAKALKLSNNPDQLKSKLNNIVVSDGIFEISDKEIPSKFKLNKGVSKIYNHHDQYVVIKVADILMSSQKSLENVKGSVINDYQNQIEKQWLVMLKDKYPVQINQNILDKVKTQM